MGGTPRRGACPRRGIFHRKVSRNQKLKRLNRGTWRTGFSRVEKLFIYILMEPKSVRSNPRRHLSMKLFQSRVKFFSDMDPRQCQPPGGSFFFLPDPIESSYRRFRWPLPSPAKVKSVPPPPSRKLANISPRTVSVLFVPIVFTALEAAGVKGQWTGNCHCMHKTSV